MWPKGSPGDSIAGYRYSMSKGRTPAGQHRAHGGKLMDWGTESREAKRSCLVDDGKGQREGWVRQEEADGRRAIPPMDSLVPKAHENKWLGCGHCCIAHTCTHTLV